MMRPGIAPMYVRRCPRNSASSRTPPSDIRSNCLPNARAIEHTEEIFDVGPRVHDDARPLRIVDVAAALLEEGVGIAENLSLRHYKRSPSAARTEMSTPCSSAAATFATKLPAASRVIAHERVYDALQTKLVARVEKLRLGPGAGAFTVYEKAWNDGAGGGAISGHTW